MNTVMNLAICLAITMYLAAVITLLVVGEAMYTVAVDALREREGLVRT